MKRIALPLAIVAVLTAVAAGLLTTRSHDRPEFGKGSYDQVVEAVHKSGLSTCDENTSGGSDVTGAYEHQTYELTTGDCAPNLGLMVVRAYGTAGELDRIGQDTYAGDSVLGYRWQQYVISVTQGNAPEIYGPFRKAMDELGAKKVYDRT